MKINTTLFKLGFAFLCISFVIGCTSTDDSIDNREHGYGYVQFKLYKQGTRADQLEYLRDAHKITLTLRKDNQTINQTVLVEEADKEVSEFGLRTENLKLMVGSYQLTGYTIYDAVDEKLLSGAPIETMNINVIQSKVTVQSLDLNVVPRGHFQFKLTKDLSAIKPNSRAAQDERDFTFDEIDKADIILRNQQTGRSFTINDLSCTFVMDDRGSSYIQCDSIIEAPAATYKLERYTLWDKNTRPLSIADSREDDITYVLEDNKTLKAEVKVAVNPTALYLLDCIALKKIWDDMHGEEWSWLNDGFPEGANWNFDKDPDLWNIQPGVSVHPNGRVASLNLGSFNPRGPVSEAVGQLDALVELWLGTHNDLTRDEQENGLYNVSYYSTWARHLKGETRGQYRWELNKEEMRARYPKKTSEIFEKNIRKSEAIALWNLRKPSATFDKMPVPARPYATVDHGVLTNRLTSLPKSIGNLVNLEALFIANGEISEIPEEIKNCISLTDLEIYNCPKMKTFPMTIAKMPNLILLNIANNLQMPASEIEQGLDAVFNGPSKMLLQILYAYGNNIEEFPESAKNLKKIGLLDLANNKIHTIHPMTQDISPVQFFLDNNRLTSLPKNLCRVDDLEALSVSDNLLTELPNIFTLKTDFFIGNIDFSYNKIKTIEGYDNTTMELVPDAGGEVFQGIKATTLNLAGNMYEGGFPAAFSLSKSDIAQYNFSYNNLDSIGAKGLMGLSTTVALDFSSNKIEEAPLLKDILIGKEMPFLTGVDLSFNSFKEFPKTLFNGYGITSFFFSSQVGVVDQDTGYRCFTTWPEGIEQYAGIKVLKMDGNDIRVIRIFPANLNYLSLDNNPNVSVTIPAEICARIPTNSFGFTYDATQTGIVGCPILGIED